MTEVLARSCTECELGDEFAGRTVSDFMITAPKTLPITITVADAYAEFHDDHVHMLLLADNGFLRGTLLRADLSARSPSSEPAFLLSTLAQRTIHRDEPLTVANDLLTALDQRQLAVVDANNTLLGLLCLKKSRRGFCSDSGVATRAYERSRKSR